MRELFTHVHVNTYEYLSRPCQLEPYTVQYINVAFTSDISDMRQRIVQKIIKDVQ
jgi:hypothetical protein